MAEKNSIGIIICDRYRTCAGGKCLRSLRNREGAFKRYLNKEVELVGYTTCNGCPGGNVEYACGEMVKNGAKIIHFATGLLVGYPPCPYIETFKAFIEERYGLEVVLGTHPMPQSYYDIHASLGTYQDPSWEARLEMIMADEALRIAYN